MSPRSRMLRIALMSEYAQTDLRKKPAARSCDTCQWPDRCTADRLCWAAGKAAIRAEREAPPARVWDEAACVSAVHAWVAGHGRPPSRDEWAKASDEHPSWPTVQSVFGSWAAGLKAAGQLPLAPYGKVRRPK